MRGALHHVEIYVSDLNRSAAFWEFLLERLGYEPHQSWHKGRSWRLGETYLVFVQTKARYLEDTYHRCRTGLNHLAFHTESRADLDELARELTARGVAILYPEQGREAGGPGTYALFFEDPDRIKVELVAPPA